MTNLFATLKKCASFTVALLFTAIAFAQQAVKFKMEYLPELKYVMAVDMKMDMLMDLKGDSAAAIKAQSGGALPMKMVSNNQMEIEIATAKKLASTNKFPLTLKYSKLDNHITMNGQEMPVNANSLAGLEIKGWGGGPNMLEIDTTTNKSLGPGLTTATLSKMLNNLFQQIKFPEKALRVGESFEQTFNMPIPLPGMAMDFAGKTTYKLIAVNNGIAEFDLVSSGTMNMKGDASKPMNMTATMNGGGKMKFNEAQHFFAEMSNDMTMTYDMVMDKMNMAGDMKMLANYKVTIVPNK